jgi:hypothetical protein
MHISLLLVLFSLLSPSSQARSANLYIALGLNTSYVNEKELKRAFRTRAIETHPDKFTNKKNNHKNINREEDFQLVSESYTRVCLKSIPKVQMWLRKFKERPKSRAVLVWEQVGKVGCMYPPCVPLAGASAGRCKPGVVALDSPAYK